VSARRANKRPRKKGKPRKVGRKSGPRSFEYDVGQDILHVLGPMIMARWSVTEALATQLASEGKPVPSPLAGFLLLDTGAKSTCIDNVVADTLGLAPIRIAKSHGVHGESEVPVYNARLTIAIEDAVGARTEHVHEGETWGAEGLTALGHPHPKQRCCSRLRSAPPAATASCQQRSNELRSGPYTWGRSVGGVFGRPGDPPS